jgi:branched-chain amino acid transport system permease protein
MGIFLIQVLNSLFYASVLFLIASGLTLIFGVMRIVNLAHGSLYAIGAYITAWLVGSAVAGGFTAHGLIFFLLLPLGAVGVGIFGALIEPTLLRPFYRRAEEYQLLVTFGLLLILEDGMRFVFGGVPIPADAVADALPSVKILGFLYPAYNFVVIAVGVVAALALWGFIYRTRFGILLRATAQDRRMAEALGLDVRRIYLLAFTIGCFLAGIGGAIVVPSQAAVLGMGIDALVVAFVVVVIGGMGSLKGALVGALIVAFFRTIGVQFFPEEELAFLYLLAGIVLVIRPTGLFGAT